MIETIEWVACSERLPDDETSVLICTIGAAEPVWLGYHDSAESSWVDAEGLRVSVAYWAALPKGPRA